jgi:hypothetical protein
VRLPGVSARTAGALVGLRTKGIDNQPERRDDNHSATSQNHSGTPQNAKNASTDADRAFLVSDRARP